MAKYYGAIGFSTQIETEPGVYENKIQEVNYAGDKLSNSRRLRNGQSINDDISISNRISILADPFAYSNFHNIVYATYLGTKWKVDDVEVEYPRLILSLSEVYNEQV